MADNDTDTDTEVATEVEDEKQNQVLKREGLEEELMQQGRSDEAETIAGVDSSSPAGEENR